MRTSKLTAEEVVQAERSKDERVHSRAKGFAKMKERDAGVARLTNGVVMHWGQQDGAFALTIPSYHEPGRSREVEPRMVVFDAEEFRRSLRWV